jgi:uncharacterized membrane protein YtjA (UPF0391 family)
MLAWAFISLITALTAGAVGWSGVAGSASSFAWMLSMAFVIAALILFIGSHRPRVF